METEVELLPTAQDQGAHRPFNPMLLFFVWEKKVTKKTPGLTFLPFLLWSEFFSLSDLRPWGWSPRRWRYAFGASLRVPRSLLRSKNRWNVGPSTRRKSCRWSNPYWIFSSRWWWYLISGNLLNRLSMNKHCVFPGPVPAPPRKAKLPLHYPIVGR